MDIFILHEGKYISNKKIFIQKICTVEETLFKFLYDKYQLVSYKL